MCNMSRWKTQALAAFTGDRIEIPQNCVCTIWSGSPVWLLYKTAEYPAL